MDHKRRNHYDITNTVNVSHAGSVRLAVQNILSALFPRTDLHPITEAFDTFSCLYAGTLPGYVGCDTWYHDAQHSLDCTLAAARLVDGHERSVWTTHPLGEQRSILTIVIALFHDAGYIRREQDAAKNGAEYTLTHVRRSGEFLAEFLPKVGLETYVESTKKIIHYTGYEIALERIGVKDPQDHKVGCLLGTADILSQLSDRCYLEKCRDYLYREFEIAGLAGARHAADAPPMHYDSPEDLLRKTPSYIGQLRSKRLDGFFEKTHRYMEVHFGEENPYLEQIAKHVDIVHTLNRQHGYHLLRRRPHAIQAAEMRNQVKPPLRGETHAVIKRLRASV